MVHLREMNILSSWQSIIGYLLFLQHHTPGMVHRQHSSPTKMEAIIEARRNVNIAKAMLADQAKEKDGLFQNRTYVKKAGVAVYSSLLKAIDALLTGDKRESLYQDELYKIDKKITSHFVTAQQILQTSMGIDGSRSVEIAKMGISEAEKIIGWVENRLNRIQK